MASAPVRTLQQTPHILSTTQRQLITKTASQKLASQFIQLEVTRVPARLHHIFQSALVLPPQQRSFTGIIKPNTHIPSFIFKQLSISTHSTKTTQNSTSHKFSPQLLEAAVQQLINQIQYRLFSQNTPWNTQTQSNSKKEISDAIYANPLFAAQKENELKPTLDTLFRQNINNYTQSTSGSLFRLQTRSTTGFVQHQATQIKSTKGTIYELIEKPDQDIIDAINSSTHLHFTSKKTILGQGAYGIVALAKVINPEPGEPELVAIKHMKDPENAIREVEKYKEIGRVHGLIHMIDYISIEQKNDDISSTDSFIVLPLYDAGHGRKISKNIAELRNTDAVAAQDLIENISLEYIKNVATLHDKGFIHRDIKPENFMHSVDGQIVLADYGISEKGNDFTHYKSRMAGTPGYFPPEWKKATYTGKGHDAFALGLTLLELKLGKVPHFHKEAHVKVMGFETSLLFDKENNCLGASRLKPLFRNLSFTTLDQVIIGLLDENSETRLSVKEALNTPFFKDIEKKLLSQ